MPKNLRVESEENTKVLMLPSADRGFYTTCVLVPESKTDYSDIYDAIEEIWRSGNDEWQWCDIAAALEALGYVVPSYDRASMCWDAG